MANERLRLALLERGHTPTTVGEKLAVDPKTVERWVNGRRPYRRYRYHLSQLLQIDEAQLWPDAVDPEQVASVSASEIIGIYPNRSSVPREAWMRLFDSAEERIGVLVYAGLFLAEDATLLAILRQKARDGVQIRILLGDPNSKELRERSIEEGIDEALAGKVRNALVLLKKLREADSVEIRLHGATLYNSIYWADDELMVNTHIYGAAAAQAPVIHLRRMDGGTIVTTYLASFERVWDSALPLDHRDTDRR